MRRLRRARRPLVALVALVLALVIGYAIKAANSGSDDRPGPGGTVRPPGTASTAGSSTGSSASTERP